MGRVWQALGHLLYQVAVVKWYAAGAGPELIPTLRRPARRRRS